MQLGILAARVLRQQAPARSVNEQGSAASTRGGPQLARSTSGHGLTAAPNASERRLTAAPRLAWRQRQLQKVRLCTFSQNKLTALHPAVQSRQNGNLPDLVV